MTRLDGRDDGIRTRDLSFSKRTLFMAPLGDQPGATFPLSYIPPVFISKEGIYPPHRDEKPCQRNVR